MELLNSSQSEDLISARTGEIEGPVKPNNDSKFLQLSVHVSPR